MHPCLEVLDILRLILQELPFGTLLKCALACHGFTEPALQLLWAEHATVFRLLKTIPARILTRAEDGEKLQLARTMLPADWERPLYYGRMVLTLKWGAPDEETLLMFDDVEALLSSIPDNLELLPNLRHLSIVAGYMSGFSLLKALLPRSLRRFELLMTSTTYPYAEAEYEILMWLQFRSPELEQLKLWYEEIRHFDTYWAIDHVARSAKHLTHITLNKMRRPLGERTVDYLATHTPLRRLEWTPATGQDVNSENGILPPLTFPLPDKKLLEAGCFRQLDFLSIHLANWELAIQLVKSMTNSPLVHLDITMASPTPRSIALGSFLVLLSGYAHTLTHVLLHDNFQSRLLRDLSASQIQTMFTPLFHLQRLHTFEVRMPISYHLDSLWLSEAANSWPHLRSIAILETSDRPRSPPSKSLSDLINLLRRCPELRSFQLSLIYKPVPFDTYRGIQNLYIRHLDTQFSVMQGSWGSQPRTLIQVVRDIPPDALSMFRCLMSMFPMLRSVSPAQEFLEMHINGEEAYTWRVLSDLLRTTDPHWY